MRKPVDVGNLNFCTFTQIRNILTGWSFEIPASAYCHPLVASFKKHRATNKRMKKTLTISFIIASIFTLTIGFKNSANEKPKISFTFDDGSTRDYVNYKLKDWNQLILDNLQKHDIKAVFFVTGSRLTKRFGCKSVVYTTHIAAFLCHSFA